MTDNLVYDPSLEPDERTGDRAGSRNDRFAFTDHDTSQEYHVAAALAAALRVLRGYDDALAAECLKTAKGAWTYEQSRTPVSFRAAYVPGNPEAQQVLAAVELLLTTREAVYGERLAALLPVVKRNVRRVGWAAARRCHCSKTRHSRQASAKRWKVSETNCAKSLRAIPSACRGIRRSGASDGTSRSSRSGNTTCRARSRICSTARRSVG